MQAISDIDYVMVTPLYCSPFFEIDYSAYTESFS